MLGPGGRAFTNTSLHRLLTNATDTGKVKYNRAVSPDGRCGVAIGARIVRL
jgi:hypothetical protein